jgi:RNA-directed DNA polymerase
LGRGGDARRYREICLAAAWVNYFRHAVCKHTLNNLKHFVEWRVIRWLRKRHRWRWKQFRRRYTTPTG